MAQQQFQTEVNQLLQLIIHSLYSHKEIFLRELISNASDAIDKLRFLTLTDEKYKGLPFEPQITLSFTAGDQPTLTIADTGIGMDEQDLATNLGTIARSGTKEFISALSQDDKKDANLIGQFGVGFYSAFMVADMIEVVSRKAGTDAAFRWTSDGKTGFEIAPAARAGFGTTVTLHLNAEGKEYASRWSLESIIRKYSNHVTFPIHLQYTEEEGGEEGKEKQTVAKDEQINAATALWRRPKSELKDEDYTAFYKELAHTDEEPLLTLHTRAEGMIEYTTLFFIPKKAPFDLFRSDYRAGVKLYVKRVFITDDEKEMMPQWLRFLRGIIDCEDLPLNVSREILQQNAVMLKIKSNAVKGVLAELAKLLKENRERYTDFWKEFSVPMKEGMYQDYANRDALCDLLLAKSSSVDGYTTLTEYKERMGAEQKAIYYIAGGNEATLRQSPLLEFYKEKGIEVLILDEQVDDIVFGSAGEYQKLPFKAVNRADAADELKSAGDKEKEKLSAPVAEKVKAALGARVKDVKVSSRLTESPACITLDAQEPGAHIRAMMKMMGHAAPGELTPILEINPNHAIVTKLSITEDQALITDISFLLLEQAMLLEGVELQEPAEFVRRLNRVMSRAS